MKYCRKPLKAAMVAAVLAGGAASAARADDAAAGASTQPDVSSEIQALRARIDQLEAQQKQQQVQHDKDQQQAALAQTLNDADRHSRFLDATGVTAGYDAKAHRFFIASDDGNFVWRPWLHLQFREVTNDRQDFYYKTKGKDEIDNGFEVRRMRFGFDGNMFSPDFTYFVNWATVRASSNSTLTVRNSAGATVGTTTVSNNLGGAPLLEEAWVKYNFHDTPFYVKAGQLKDPLLHDQIVSSRYQHGIERSLIGDIFANGDAFTEAVTFIVDPKSWFRVEAGVNHGIRSANTNFLDTPTNALDWGVAGRAEFKAFGRWQDYGQVGAIEIKDPLLVFGVGADSSSTGHSEQTVAVADGQYADPGGFSLYGAFVDRYTTHNFGIWGQSATGGSITQTNPAVLGHHTNEYAAMAEVGYVFSNHIEPYGRVEYMHLQGTTAGSNNWVQVYTAGVNIFFYGNRLKITPEIIYLPKGIPIDDTPSDVFASAPGKAEIVGEVQLQWLL